MDGIKGWLAADLADDERGATAIEYAVLAALIAGVVVVIIAALGGQIEQAFNDFYSNFTGRM